MAMPAMPSVFFLGIALAMSFMLSEDRLRVAQLDRDLRAAELAVQYHRQEVSYLFRLNLLDVLSEALAHALTKSHGLGLGLSVCRTIITAHAGELWADGAVQQGAAFCFSLPACPDPKEKR